MLAPPGEAMENWQTLVNVAVSIAATGMPAPNPSPWSQLPFPPALVPVTDYWLSDGTYGSFRILVAVDGLEPTYCVLRSPLLPGQWRLEATTTLAPRHELRFSTWTAGVGGLETIPGVSLATLTSETALRSTASSLLRCKPVRAHPTLRRSSFRRYRHSSIRAVS